MLEDMVKVIVQDEKTSHIYILGNYSNPTEKQQGGSSWTRAHEEFQPGESDAGALAQKDEVIHDFTKSIKFLKET